LVPQLEREIGSALGDIVPPSFVPVQLEEFGAEATVWLRDIVEVASILYGLKCCKFGKTFTKAARKYTGSVEHHVDAAVFRETEALVDKLYSGAWLGGLGVWSDGVVPDKAMNQKAHPVYVNIENVSNRHQNEAGHSMIVAWLPITDGAGYRRPDGKPTGKDTKERTVISAAISDAALWVVLRPVTISIKSPP
jgi:hypothetical protein